MSLFWSSRGHKEIEMSRFALGERSSGDIAVVISGGKLDANLVYLGCQLAKGARRKVRFMYVIEVPRAFPLKAVLPEESGHADQLLNAAMVVAHRVGCDAVAEIVQARDTGAAVVDEVKDSSCALLLMGSVRRRGPSTDTDRTASFVLANAPCRVWLVQDPPAPVLQWAAS
jgi:nucleotide-binding universal stress UspA family protein